MKTGLTAAAVVLVGLLAWSWVRASNAIARADVYAEELELVTDSLEGHFNTLAEAGAREHALRDSASRVQAELADSIARLQARRQAERADAARRAEAAVQAGYSIARAIAEAVSDPVEREIVAGLVTDREEQVGAERGAAAEQIRSLSSQLLEERAIWATERRLFVSQLAAADSTSTAKDRVIASLEEAVRLQGLENGALRDARRAGFWDRVKWVGVGVLVGSFLPGVGS